jgi:CDI immunity proteins
MTTNKEDNKSIEQLENDFWEPPREFPTELVKNVFLLRKKHLRDLDSNEIRILISQNIGLKYLVHRAIGILKNDMLHEAIYFPGDLLSALLNIESGYWQKNPTELNMLLSILKEEKSLIKDEMIDEVDEEVNEKIKKFLSIYD